MQMWQKDSTRTRWQTALGWLMLCGALTLPAHAQTKDDRKNLAVQKKTQSSPKTTRPSKTAEKSPPKKTTAPSKTAPKPSAASPKITASPKQPTPNTAATAKTRGPLRDGQAEQRLLAIYELINQGRSKDALAQAQSLARDYPNFHLAQLTLGDLLNARTGPISQLGNVPQPKATAHSEAITTLQELRRESLQRVQAQRLRPPAGRIPAEFLTLPAQTRHAIVVDASRSRLYLFENSATGLNLVADYYASVGKLGIEKNIEGDQRTPLGVYFITSRLDPAKLTDFYGAGALPINYPNPLDVSRGKTGSGIWLHGTPSDQFSRAPLATDGCVALANPDLERLLRSVEPRATPVIISPKVQWVVPQSMQADRKAFEDVLNNWRIAKSAGDMSRLMNFYAKSFEGHKKKPLTEWAHTLQAESRALKGRSIELKDKSILRWKDSSDTMVVTFGEVAEGEQTGTIKRQYWTREGQHWKIFFEGVIG